MSSPKKSKDPLCCIVNKAGDCKSCKRPACTEHSFECIECLTICYDCAEKDFCSRCNTPVCNHCLMNSATQKGICPFCYHDENINSGDSFGNYPEDEFDR